jgi:hypothetical protein
MEKTPRAGEIFYLTKDKPYQVITLGIHKETCESMVIYQALFGDYGRYVLPLSKFMDEVTGGATYEKSNNDTDTKQDNDQIEDRQSVSHEEDSQDAINEVLLSFLEADSYSDKLEVITSNIKEIDDRLINDMAVSLDCTVNDGPIDQRLHGLIYCLKQLSRFDIKRIR